MRKTALFLMVFVLDCGLIFGSAGAQERRHRGTTISTGDEKGITDCGQVKIRIGDGETARSQLQQTVPRSAVSTLQVQSSKNGGVHVQGWNSDQFLITACLAAGATAPMKRKRWWISSSCPSAMER